MVQAVQALKQVHKQREAPEEEKHYLFEEVAASSAAAGSPSMQGPGRRALGQEVTLAQGAIRRSLLQQQESALLCLCYLGSAVLLVPVPVRVVGAVQVHFEWCQRWK